MDAFEPRSFMYTSGIIKRVLGAAIVTAIVVFFVSLVLVAVSKLLAAGLWAAYFIFMICYALVVIKDNVPERKGAVKTSSVMKSRISLISKKPSQGGKNDDTIIEPIRFDLVEKPLDLRHYILSKKKNHNVLICGTPGSGKSKLTRYLLDLFPDYQRIIFNFKSDDMYMHLGPTFKGVKMTETTPDAFANPEAFTQAFMTTFALESRGIQAGQIQSIARKHVLESKNWDELTEKLSDSYRTEKDKNKQAAIAYIQTHIESLVSKASVMTLGAESVVFDLSDLNEDQITFYSELLLRSLWEDIKTGKRKQTILCIDEAHRLTERGHYSIYTRVAREIRAFGMLITATQFYTDMGAVAGDFDTQFVFKTTQKADLDALSAIDPKLSWAASSMPRYTFTDASYEFQHYVIPEMKLYYEPKEEDLDYKHAVVKTAKVTPPQAISALDVEQEVWTILSTKDMDYVSSIAKQIEEKHKNLVKTRADWDTIKGMILNAIRKFETEGSVSHFVEKIEGKRMYFMRSKNMTEQHRQIETDIKAILKAKNVRILKVARTGSGAPDIETPDFYIEVETGRKHDTTDLSERIKTLSKPVVIITPNDTISRRYTKHRSDKVHVVAFENFEEFLENQLIET
jgi:energy-coupling factor transporter ATP-binding protein EcfA2